VPAFDLAEPPVALQRVLQMEPDDGLFLPLLQPEIAGTQPLCSFTLP